MAESSPISLPKAGNKLLEMEARFLTSSLECRLYNSGIGDLASDVNGDLPSEADIFFFLSFFCLLIILKTYIYKYIYTIQADERENGS